jgi:hypothetical protein
VRLLVGDPELVLFEEGPPDGDVNRPFGRRAESPRTFGDRIRIVLDASATLSRSSWMAMNAGPRTFQCACLTCACRSMAAARCRFSTSAALERMFSESVLDVRYICVPSIDKPRPSFAIGNRQSGVHDKIRIGRAPEPVNCGKSR